MESSRAETSHRYTVRAVNAWLDGISPKPIVDEAPEHLRELIRYSAKIQCRSILYWVKKFKAGCWVPERFMPTVNQCLEGRKNVEKETKE